jgi:pyruvate dehydrogenase E1 component alpha subunit
MQLIRRFEEKVIERFRAGDLAGFLHACIGQEAVAVGVCYALGNGDVMGSTHRAHGHVIANGTPPSSTARLGSEVRSTSGAASAGFRARSSGGSNDASASTSRRR